MDAKLWIATVIIWSDYLDLKVGLFNPFHATSRFLYPLKTENLWFSNVVKGYRKRLYAWNGLTKLTKIFISAWFKLALNTFGDCANKSSRIVS